MQVTKKLQTKDRQSHSSFCALTIITHGTYFFQNVCRVFSQPLVTPASQHMKHNCKKNIYIFAFSHFSSHLFSPMSFEVEMNLTILPSDVIRKLISVEDESLPSIRSVRVVILFNFLLNQPFSDLFIYFVFHISRRWNKLCMDHFTQRKQIPTIESVYFHRDLLDQKTIKICMKKKYLKYLETMKYRISCIPNTSDVIIILFFSRNSHIFFQLIELSHRYPSDSSVFQGKLRFDVASIFKRCPNIERLEMSLGRIDCSERKAELLEIVGLSRNGSVKNLVFSRLDYFCVETAYVVFLKMLITI